MSVDFGVPYSLFEVVENLVRSHKYITKDDLDGMNCQMVVYGLIELVAGLEELHYFIWVFVRIDYLIVNYSSVIKQDWEIVLTKTQVHHLRVPLNVIPFVNIYRVPLIINYVEHP